MPLLIKNARIVNSDKMSRQACDIFIDKGVIADIGENIQKKDVKVIDAGQRLVVPGLIDLHVHLREPGREDRETIETGSQAAAKGGFTTIMCMPNTTPVIDNAAIVESILKEARRVGLVNVIPIGAISKGQKGEDLADIVELRKAGCLAVSDDGQTVANTQLMRMALEYANMAGVLVIDHCQDACLSQGRVMNEGFNSTTLGLKGDPGVSETIIIARDIELCQYFKIPLHLAHVSLKRSVDIIRAAKQQNVKITAEVCPHHFTLTDDAVKTFDTNTKVNPPLRAPEDVDALKQGLKDGTIDCIATDHAPHVCEEKELDYDNAPFGMIGLETAVGLAVTELVMPGILDWPQVVEKMSTTPARIVGLAQKGRIEKGFDADLTIIDPEEEWTVNAKDFVSKSKNSPFIGRTLRGRVKTTICHGRVVFQEEGKS